MTAGSLATPSPEEHPNLFTVLASLGSDKPSWQEDALCAQTDPEAFFPEKGGSTREAKRICVGCNVKQECLELALKKDERFGIWGGKSERERRRLKRTDKLPPPLISTIELVLVQTPDSELSDVSDEGQIAMKDEARFPMVRAFLLERQGRPFVVYGGDRGKLPGDLAADAKLDSVKDLRQVLRKMGRMEDDVTVLEDPDGTLWAELVVQKKPITPREPSPDLVLEQEVVTLRPAETPELVEPLAEEVGPEPDDLDIDFDGTSVDPAENELDGEIEACGEAAQLEPAAAEPKATIELPAQLEEPVIEQDLASVAFVEMALPDGYVSPSHPKQALLIPTDERKAVVLGWLAEQADNRVLRSSITPQVAQLFGVSQGAASSLIHSLAADGLIGRQLSGKQSIVIWLRQAGWNWLQAYSHVEKDVEPVLVVEEPVLVVDKPALADEPPFAIVESEQITVAVEPQELIALRGENAALVAALAEALRQRDEAKNSLEELKADFRDHVQKQILPHEKELNKLEAVLQRIDSPPSRHLSSVEPRTASA